MNAGYITVSKELMNDKNWPEIETELGKVFKEVCRKEVGSGMIEIHGESDLFDVLPEGATAPYHAIFSNREGISFLRFGKG